MKKEFPDNAAIYPDRTHIHMITADIPHRYLYWFTDPEFEAARDLLTNEGYSMKSTLMTPCQVLKSRGKSIVYAGGNSSMN